MSDAAWLQDALNRLCAIQKECPTSPPANNAVPYTMFTQDAMPYWTNRVHPQKLVPGMSQDYRVYRCRIGMTYVRAIVTEGITFQPEAGLYADIPIITEWFGGAIELQSKQYPQQMRYLSPKGAYIDDAPVIYLNQLHSGIGAHIVGAEFTIGFEVDVPTPQRY